MSYDINVYFPASKTPTDQQWQAAIEQLGVKLSFAQSFNINEMEGWLAQNLEEEESGFEIHSRRITDDDRKELELPVSFNFEVTLGSDDDEDSFLSAIWSAAALATCTGGRLIDCQSGAEIGSDDAPAWAQETIDETDIEDSPLSEAAAELVNSAIDSAMTIINSGEDLAPFVLALNNGKAEEHNLEADTSVDAVASAGKLIKSLPKSVSIYVVAALGSVDLGDETVDAILVEVGERDVEVAYMIGQPYSMPEEDEGHEIEILGDAIIMDEKEILF